MQPLEWMGQGRLHNLGDTGAPLAPPISDK